jgi:foldase protein PrsA
MLPNNKKGQAKWFVMMLVLVIVISMLSGCAKKGGSTSPSGSPGVSSSAAPAHKDTEVASTYNGGQITYGELNKYIDTTLFLNPQQGSSKGQPGFDEYMMKQLVVFKVVGAKATDQNKKDADAKVKQQMDSFQKYYDANKAQMDPALKAANVTIPDIEAYFHTAFNALIEMSSKVTDKQVQDAYDAAIKADPDAYTSANIDHILIALKDPADPTGQKDLRTKEEALKIAADVKGQLTKGGDFAALAKKYSDDTGSKDKGGNLGDALIGGYVPEFKKAAAELPINTISDPVLSQFGYHIIKVESRVKKTLADEKETLRNQQADALFTDFMNKDFLTLNYKSNIPTPTPEPSATPAASPAGSPAASSAATPAASPAATPAAASPTAASAK